MRKLQLLKPLCFFDLETTGINILIDKIVSISIIKLFPDGSRVSFYRLINPGCPIPESAIAIHGITNQMVSKEKSFSEYSDQIDSLFTGSDIAGFNSNNFDIPLLSIEFQRVGTTFPKTDAKFVDVCNIFKRLNPRNLTAAVNIYTNDNLEDAHNAEADNEATINVLIGMLQRHEDLPLNIEDLSKISDHDQRKVDIMGKFIYNEDGKYVYAFGKHRGEQISFSNIGFIGWMLQGKDFHPNTIMWARQIYNEIIGNGSAKLPF